MSNVAYFELLTFAAIGSIAVLGLYIQMASGQLNFAQAAFVGIGGYVSGVVTVSLGIPFPVALLIAVAAVATIAGLFSVLVLRLSHFFYAIAALGFAEMAITLVENSSALGGKLGFYGVPATITKPVIFAALAAVFAVTLWFDKSRTMMGLRACGDDNVAAASIGCDIRQLRVFAASLGGAYAGLSGVLYVHYLTSVDPSIMGLSTALDYLIFVAVGGVTTAWGPLVGTFLLMLIPEALRFSSELRYVLYGAAFVVLMLVRPQGLLIRRPGHRRPLLRVGTRSGPSAAEGPAA